MPIWAVAGGKGGTGKSLVAHGLAVALADRGLRVLLVDADFGAPNQHTLCGLRKPGASLAQFFEERTPLESLTVDTPVPGLRLIPGNINNPDTDGMTWAQKQKLFRHLRMLQADHVLLDLGAGSQYDVLDAFLQADLQVAVVTPDALAVENLYLFVKNLRHRQLGHTLSAFGLKEQARNLWRQRADHGLGSAREFLLHLRSVFPDFARQLDQDRERMVLNLVLNQVREFSQVELGSAVTSSIRRYFQTECVFSGYLQFDRELWQRVGQDRAAAMGTTSFMLRQAMERLAAAMLGRTEGWAHGTAG